MAKAKKKKVKFLPILMVLAIALALVAIIVPIATDFFIYRVSIPEIDLGITTIDADTIDSVFKGTDVLFGSKTENGTVVYEGSVIGLVAFILSIAGAVFAILALVLGLMKKRGIARFTALVGGLVLLVGGIMYACAPANFISTNLATIDDLVNGFLENIGSLLDLDITKSNVLDIGAWLGLVGGCLGGVSCIGGAILG